MTFLVSVIANLVAAVLGFWLGWLWQRIHTQRRRARALRFWKKFLGKDFKVVVGRWTGAFQAHEPSGFVGVGDANALSDLDTTFENLGIERTLPSYADQLHGDELDTNLIVIGGPVANPLSHKILEKLKPCLTFGYHDSDDFGIYDVLEQKYYVPEQDEETQEVQKDYSVVIRAPNPFAPEKRILLIAGSFGFGTWAGVRFVSSPKFQDEALAQAEFPIECLIDADVVFGAPQTPSLLVLRKIEREDCPELKVEQVAKDSGPHP